MRHIFIPFLLIITVFFIVISIYDFYRENAFLYKNIKSELHRELLVKTIVAESAINSMNLQRIESEVANWGQTHPNIISIKFIIDDNITLAQYSSGVKSEDVLNMGYSDALPNGRKIAYKVVYDLGTLRKESFAMALQWALGASLCSLLLAVILWFMLRKWAFNPLEKEIADHEKAQIKLKKYRRNLEDRVNELTFFFDISKVLLEQKLSLDDLLRQIVSMIPSTCQNHNVCVGLSLKNGKSFFSDSFQRFGHMVKADVTGSGNVIGTLEIFYDGTAHEHYDANQFMSGQKMLVDAIANQVGKIIEYKERESALKEAKEKAELANKAKSEFIANMSHELRTPLNAILGFTELVLHSRISEEDKSSLKIVLNSAKSLLQILNDILDISKLEAGQLEIENLDFFLKDSLDIALKSFSVNAKSKGLELECNISPETPQMLIGDARRLRQILINLIGNAIKFTENGGVYINVAVDSRKENLVCLLFEVKDTGIGIHQKKQHEIFDAFAQVDASSTRHYGGAGLGLTICFRILKMMEGKLWVKSKPGEGSSFYALIPFHTKAP